MGCFPMTRPDEFQGFDWLMTVAMYRAVRDRRLTFDQAAEWLAPLGLDPVSDLASMTHKYRPCLMAKDGVCVAPASSATFHSMHWRNYLPASGLPPPPDRFHDALEEIPVPDLPENWTHDQLVLWTKAKLHNARVRARNDPAYAKILSD